MQNGDTDVIERAKNTSVRLITPPNSYHPKITAREQHQVEILQVFQGTLLSRYNSFPYRKFF